MTKVVVLGGGPAGCSAAYFLRRRGFSDITIIENDSLGGCSRTRLYHRIPYEFGPQVMFTDKDYLREVFERWVVQHAPPSDDGEYHYLVSVDGTLDRLHDFPLTLRNIDLLPNKEQVVWELYHLELLNPDYSNFENYAISRVGRTMYETYIKNYNRKAWQMDPKDMDTDWVRFRPLSIKRTNTRFGSQWQGHPGDYNPMWEGMVEGVSVVAGNARIDDELNCIVDNDRIEADIIVSTLTLSDKLQFINTFILFLGLESPEFITPSCFTTFPNNYRFVRAFDFKQQFYVDTDCSLLSLEFPWVGECPVDEFIAEGLWFCRNILKREPVEHWYDNRTRVYPLATRGNTELFYSKLEELSGANIIPIGRQGMHAYCSKDTAIRMGMDTARYIEELTDSSRKTKRLYEMREDLH
jgi:UDP-galactopyranose mutase